MANEEEIKDANAPVDKLEGGTYEIIRNRLDKQSRELRSRLDSLNGNRKEIFGSVETELISSERISTDNNCLSQDIFVCGDKFLFGYNVMLGLKSELALEDVFAVYHYEEGTFKRDDITLIGNDTFRSAFNDLYKYYKKAQFVKFTQKGHNLYMVFRIGEGVGDLKVFKWQITDNTLTYLDDRSVHEYNYPPQHEFEWKRTTRDMHQEGKHPHISIEDRVFVETVGGDLTIKVEDNTLDGSGIYEEDVDHKDQTLDDGEFHYSIVGSLILLKIRPYQEKDYRYIVFNEKTQTAVRVDDVADCCILLPDDHGIIFSKGYYLQSGEYKRFDTDINDMVFERRIASPNGEDYLYVFYNRLDGIYVLLSYNLINQAVATPTICSGFSLFSNGEMLYFKAADEPAKHHAIQLWRTPYCHADYVSPNNEYEDHFLFKLGNKEIVRGMAECHELLTLLNKDDSYSGLYIDIVKKATDIVDAYFWLSNEIAANLTEPLIEIKQTSSSAIDEYEKVRKLKKVAGEKTKEISEKTETVLREIKYTSFKDINQFVKNLAELRSLRGEVITLKEVRYIDISMLEGYEQEIRDNNDTLSEKCVEFLLLDEALDPYRALVKAQEESLDLLTKATDGKKVEEDISETSHQLEMLIEIVSNLKIADATQTTRIIDNISGLFSKINQIKGTLKNKIKDLMSVEGVAEFNAQMKLLNQSVINYLDVSESPQNCEEYLTKIMVQLEELEGKFSEFDDFIIQIAEKRDEAYNAFESKKVSLQEALNKRTTSLMTAAERILKGVRNRVQGFKEINEINSYFAGDLMIDKVRDIVATLIELEDTVKADDIEGRLKTIREDTVRQLKDKQDLFEGDNLIKMGKHKFTVNSQKLDLTIVQKEDAQYFHLTGTKFFEEIDRPEFVATKDVWTMEALSENRHVYRAEYLAYKMYKAMENGDAGVDSHVFMEAEEEEMVKYVQVFMGTRYAESYVKGIHDYDGGRILKELLRISSDIGLLRFSSPARACATLFWHCLEDEAIKNTYKVKIGSFGHMRQLFPSQSKQNTFIGELKFMLEDFNKVNGLFEGRVLAEAAEYLFEELCCDGDFTMSTEAATTCRGFSEYLKSKIFADKFRDALKLLEGDTAGRYELIRNWVSAYISNVCENDISEYADETAALIYTDTMRERNVSQVSIATELQKMAGSHGILKKGIYALNFNEFMNRLTKFEEEVVPSYNTYTQLKKDMTEEYRKELRLHEFAPRILTSFVRNKLIGEVYLPLIGDNLAKQIGVAGENKRTDLMGMLLLISPPGYGKTTLMEYISNRLGLIFMKINAPAIGHEVTSLDPSEAPNAAAREEMKKLNLAFEMGDNVMIYLDDIQHTNPELLQKFISLCDGQRKIEGVYKGQPKTYDLRGRKVVVCMAGNPYTESGDKFQIPDMLANRADTYNLGDIIGDTAPVFNLSYIENSLTSNAVLNKLSTRSQKDLYGLLEIAETGSRDGIELEGQYSGEEMNEIIGVMKKMIVVRDVISKVNAEYIRSAATADEYRTEPPFKMQGSYRNMNKIVEKIIPVMNDEELETLILSHYGNESQTLTSGAEFNMLRFKELIQVQTEEEKERLVAIRKTFEKNLLFSNMDESDPMAQVIVQMGQFTDGLDNISSSISGGMQALPDLLSVMRKQTENVVQAVSPEGQGDKEVDPLSIIPDRIKIINNMPELFEVLLREQLELMRTWLKTLFEGSQENKKELGELKAMLLDSIGTHEFIIEKGKNSPKGVSVEKHKKGKKL